MPGGDRTGPTGVGPATGRGAGYCTGSDVAGYQNPRGGWGRGRRREGVGRGLQRGFRGGRGPAYAEPEVDQPLPRTRQVQDRLGSLQEMVRQLGHQLEEVSRRLGGLESELADEGRKTSPE